MKPLVFDTFCYNGDLILPLRLETLYEHVDYFILIESKLYWSGIEKESYYIDKVYPALWKYADKLIIVKIEPQHFEPTPPWFTFRTEVKTVNGVEVSNYDNWWREHSARDFCKPVIKQIAGNQPFIVSTGDVDEIPLPSIFEDPHLIDKCNDPLFLEMDFYNFNFKWQKKSKWIKPYIINHVNESISGPRIAGDWSRFIPSAGWHCSWFMTRAQMIEKFIGGSHSEWNRNEVKTSHSIDKSLQEGVDLQRRGTHEDCVPSYSCTYYGSYLNSPNFTKFQKMLDVVQG